MTVAMSAKQTAKITFTGTAGKTGASALDGEGAIRFAPHNFAADLTVAVPGAGTLQAILLPKEFYLRFPRSKANADTRRWINVTGRGDGPFGAAMKPLIDQMQRSFDPSSSLGMLDAAATVTETGRETLAGVATTRYHSTIDLAKAAAASRQTQRKQFEALVAAGTPSIDYTIWVDDEHLPRQFATSVAMPQGLFSTKGTYSDWGLPVTIKAPSADQMLAPGKLGG